MEKAQLGVGQGVPGGLADLEGSGHAEGLSWVWLARGLSAGHRLACFPHVPPEHTGGAGPPRRGLPTPIPVLRAPPTPALSFLFLPLGPMRVHFLSCPLLSYSDHKP